MNTTTRSDSGRRLAVRRFAFRAKHRATSPISIATHAAKLIDAALADQGGMEKLSYLCDRIGNRLSGSPALERAVAWAAAQMKADGLTNVVTPRVKVPHWVRGNESAAMIEPVAASAAHPGTRRQRRARPRKASPPKWFRSRASKTSINAAAPALRARSFCSTRPMKATTARWFIALLVLRARRVWARWRRWCAPSRP